MLRAFAAVASICRPVYVHKYTWPVCNAIGLAITLCCAEAACCRNEEGPILPLASCVGLMSHEDILSCSHASVTQGAGGPSQFVMHAALSET